MDNLEYLFDYDLKNCAVVTLYDDSHKSKYRLLVPECLVDSFHLLSVVRSLGMDGVFSSNSIDEILNLLNTVRIN